MAHRIENDNPRVDAQQLADRQNQDLAAALDASARTINAWRPDPRYLPLLSCLRDPVQAAFLPPLPPEEDAQILVPEEELKDLVNQLVPEGEKAPFRMVITMLFPMIQNRAHLPDAQRQALEALRAAITLRLGDHRQEEKKIANG